MIEKFNTYFPPGTPLSFILLRLRDMAKISGRFSMCRVDEAVVVADIIQPYNLNICDRCIFIAAPVSLRDLGQRQVLMAFARCVADMGDGHLLDFDEIDLEILDMDREDPGLAQGQYLRRLEALHKSITLYLWLTYRFVGVFRSQHLAFHVKTLVEDKITNYLEHLTFVPEKRRMQKQRLRKLVEAQQQRRQEVGVTTRTTSWPPARGWGQWIEEGHEEPLIEDAEEAILSDTTVPDRREGVP